MKFNKKYKKLLGHKQNNFNDIVCLDKDSKREILRLIAVADGNAVKMFLEVLLWGSASTLIVAEICEQIGAQEWAIIPTSFVSSVVFLQICLANIKKQNRAKVQLLDRNITH